MSVHDVVSGWGAGVGACVTMIYDVLFYACTK